MGRLPVHEPLVQVLGAGDLDAGQPPWASMTCWIQVSALMAGSVASVTFVPSLLVSSPPACQKGSSQALVLKLLR